MKITLYFKKVIDLIIRTNLYHFLILDKSSKIKLIT